MTTDEIALQLTLKAMETGYIPKADNSGSTDEVSQRNIRSVSEFFNAMRTAQNENALNKINNLV